MSKQNKKSRVSTGVDYEQDGKQIGSFNVPNSRNESGWGTLHMPVCVVRNGDGPTVLFTGGNHGDEYEGPVVLMKLIRSLEPEHIRGRAIILPALNMPALMAGKRLSPIDGKNMNRVFPGRWNGTITETIADYVYRELVSRAEAVIDLHSGGYSMKFAPTVMMHYLPDKDLEARTLAALTAFGAPFGMIAEELDTEGMLDSVTEEAGKVFLGTELGGAGMLTPETVRIGERGVRNMLRHFGLMAGEIEVPEPPTRMVESPDGSYFASAEADGLYEPYVEVGEEVSEGQPLGRIHFVAFPEHESALTVAARAGVLLCRRAPGHCERGDCVAVIGRDMR